MKLVRADIFCLAIPFVEGFAHSTKIRKVSDAVVVRVQSDSGAVGYGEGAPRPYVGGETVDSLVRHVQDALWPRVQDVTLPGGDRDDLLGAVDRLIGDIEPSADERAAGILAHHAARSAVELAVLDCILVDAGRSMSKLLPVCKRELEYSGVITSGSLDKAIGHASKMKRFGLPHIKVKVGDGGGIERVAALREVLGPDVSIRVDANGVWQLDEALRQLEALAAHGVDSCEEPLGRERMDDLPALCRRSPIPIMLDESLVTLQDARTVAENGGCHLFNVRVSKCGGLGRTMRFVEIARHYEIGLQIGSHVGETSVLAAAGRHLAASLPDLRFLEGSYGTLLLSEDIASPSLRFGHRGRAPLLRGPGLGMKVRDERLARYATKTVGLT